MVVPLPVCLPGYASAAALATVCLVPKTKSKFCLLLSGAGNKGAGAGRGNKKCLRCEAWKMCLFRITWLPTACCQLTIAKQRKAEQSRAGGRQPQGVWRSCKGGWGRGTDKGTRMRAAWHTKRIMGKKSRPAWAAPSHSHSLLCPLFACATVESPSKLYDLCFCAARPWLLCLCSYCVVVPAVIVVAN